MHILPNLHFEYWVSEYNKEGMIAMHCDRVPIVGYEYDRYIWFVMTKKEFERFSQGAYDFSVSDGYHKLNSFGDNCIFYDMETPREKTGVMKIPFIQINFPRFCRKLLLKFGNKLWRTMKPGDDKITLHLSSERVKRWERLYGHGSGEVVVETDDHTNTFLQECLSKSADGNLAERISHLKIIAKNGTNSFFETGKVKLSKDMDGFYFRIISPRGRCTLNGGVVDHNRDPDKLPSWSIHT